ncbi:MAG: glycosyltransferase family 4 protein [Alphaproteobacteria bacterium]|nr:glycosyltransferase family 4 protein [Alphaproteobacteria bacterium]
MSFTLNESWVILAILLTLISVGGTKFLIKYLVTLDFFDVPVSRSNHTNPVVKGGGIIIFACLAVGWLLAPVLTLDMAGPTNLPLPLFIGAAVLFAISLLDDIRHIPFILRLTFHGGAVAFVMWQMPFSGHFFSTSLPLWVDQALTWALWVWFINAFNFMDGIDGISSIESIAICLGVALFCLLFHLPISLLVICVIIALACGGFLIWNWHPANIFLGDSGSIVLGFILGYLLLSLANHGYSIAAFIIPLYYLMDTGITILKRLLDKQKIWEAHSNHFYQQAVRSGKSHAFVVKLVTLVNLWLIAFAWLSLTYPRLSLAFSVWIIIGLLASLTNKIPSQLKNLMKDRP